MPAFWKLLFQWAFITNNMVVVLMVAIKFDSSKLEKKIAPLITAT